MGPFHLFQKPGPNDPCRVSFLHTVLEDARSQGILSEEHFSVDGTLLESWASLKSFRPKGEPPKDPSGGGRNPQVDYHGQKRSNPTHASTTDPDARLARKGKGKEAKLFTAGHLLTENRNGVVAGAHVNPVTGTSAKARPSMDAQHATKVTASAFGNANASRKSSGG